MNFFKKPQAVPNQRSPLPPHIASVLRESWWLGLVVAAIYLVLVLLSYQPTDPGWSHSATHTQLQNRGGELGAWISDLLLYIFGVSAWWWVVFCITAIWWGYKRIDRVEATNRPVAMIRVSGFLILLVASCGLESLRMYSMKTALPLAPGGMLGAVIGDWLSRVIGFSGATLLMLALIAVGFSVFTGISWLQVMESFGTWLERSYFWSINQYEAWQDRKIGAVAKVVRQEKVKVEKKKHDQAEPLHIEPPQMEVPVAKKVEKAIEQEQRKEIQKPLFDDLPMPASTASGTLPSVTLLEPPGVLQETVTHETLEYTSRLIERKLADFGVEVKIVAAYPGPVITRYEIDPAVGVKGAQIVNLMKDLARALGLISIRVVETIPGKTYKIGRAHV